MPESVKKVRVTFEVAIYEPEVFMAYARKRVKACWDESYEEMFERPLTFGDAVVEAFLVSNENPAPCELGFEFTGERIVEEWDE